MKSTPKISYWLCFSRKSYKW